MSILLAEQPATEEIRAPERPVYEVAVDDDTVLAGRIARWLVSTALVLVATVVYTSVLTGDDGETMVRAEGNRSTDSISLSSSPAPSTGAVSSSTKASTAITQATGTSAALPAAPSTSAATVPGAVAAAGVVSTTPPLPVRQPTTSGPTSASSGATSSTPALSTAARPTSGRTSASSGATSSTPAPSTAARATSSTPAPSTAARPSPAPTTPSAAARPTPGPTSPAVSNNPVPGTSPAPTSSTPAPTSSTPAPTSSTPAPTSSTPVASTSPAPTSSSGQLIWSDEFDRLDTGRWALEHSTYGDGNEELQCYRPENVSVADGRLVLHAVTETYTCPNGSTRSVTSGMVRSRGVTFEPGQALEFRAKLSPADESDQSGLWPAVWSSGWAGGGWPRSGELDFLEVMTANDPTRSIFSMHYAKPDGSHGKTNKPVYGSRNFSADWHTVRFEYGVGGRLVWFLDGRQVLAVAAADTLQGYPRPFDLPINEIKINLALGGRPGPLSNRAVGAAGARFEVDFIRIYQL